MIIPGGTVTAPNSSSGSDGAGPSLTEEGLGPVAFVPLVGDQGW